MLELPEGERRQAIAAALVAGEHRFVDDDHGAPGSTEFDRGGRPGRSGADDDHVGRESERVVGRLVGGDHAARLGAPAAAGYVRVRLGRFR